MNKRLIDVVQKALDQDNTIVVEEEALKETKGFTEDYLKFLGFTRNDLKKLERQGLARRGYIDTNTATKLGRRASKTEVRWVLMVKDNAKV